MKTYDQLQISFTPSIATYNTITDLLGIQPTIKDFTKFPDNIPHIWTYEVVTKDQDPYFDFINNFLDILNNKYVPLSELGIKKGAISFWHLYEYDQQCNMEFDPSGLKRLGDNNITLCISCWDNKT